MSPSGFAEQAWDDASIDLSALPSAVRDSFRALAHARSEPLYVTLREIVTYLVDGGHEAPTVADALTFYLVNFHGVRLTTAGAP